MSPGAIDNLWTNIKDFHKALKAGELIKIEEDEKNDS